MVVGAGEEEGVDESFGLTGSLPGLGGGRRCSIFWTAVFGVFGKMYIHADPKGDSGVSRMKNAVWIDLVNMLLWLVTAVMGVVVVFSMRGKRSLHTGRAAV